MPISINVTLRANKSVPLTWAEGDANWSLLIANDQYLDSQLQSKQGSSVKLTAIAASMWAANSILYLTGTDTVEAKPTTAYGLQLLGYDSASALKIALELNNVSNTADIDKPVSNAVQVELDKKVNTVFGKGLSSNDFTNDEKTKLASLESSHFKGSFVSLSALTAAVANPVTGDYADVDPGQGENAVRYIWDDSDDIWVSSGSGTSLTAAQVKQLYESNPDTNAFTDSLKTKLDGVADGATANATNAQLRDRSTHTGTQLASTISDLAATVRGVILTGLAAGTNVAIAATDSILTAFAKLQTQLDNKLGLTAKAADSDKLNGQLASFYTATMTGATESVAGTKGLVPASSAGDQLKFLRADGTWVTISATANWGGISGTLADQLDLKAALDAKLSISDAIFTKQYPANNGALSWVSSPGTAGLLTIAHGLGVAPKFKVMYAKCITADAGFAVGDIVEVACPSGDYIGSAPGYGFAYYNPDATNMYIRFPSSANWNSLIKTTGGHTSYNIANWQYAFRAWS